jgi:3'-5' exonuclease
MTYLDKFRPVFVDVEVNIDEESKHASTYRDFCSLATFTSLAVALETGHIMHVKATNGAVDRTHADALTRMALDPAYIFVAHNAVHDMSCLKFFLGVPTPRNIWCTVQGAMRAWPRRRSGYKLRDLAHSLGFPLDLRKDKAIVGKTAEETKKYNIQDVAVLRHLYYLQIRHLTDHDQEVVISHLAAIRWDNPRRDRHRRRERSRRPRTYPIDGDPDNELGDGPYDSPEAILRRIDRRENHWSKDFL